MHPLLNAPEITRNLKMSGTGRCARVATRHLPFGTTPHSVYVHDVVGVRVDFRTAVRANLFAVWRCGGSSAHVLLLAEPMTPDGDLLPRCKRCAELSKAVADA